MSKESLENLILLAKTCMRIQEDIDMESKIGDFPQWNSLSHVEFILEIEKVYSLRISPLEIHKLTSIREIWLFLEKQKAS
ncbi:MAG: acyl carrier protein [Bdellovibrionales bacterium]|nr:acyl carrier protein [Bdellovibrionales bacterium]